MKVNPSTTSTPRKQTKTKAIKKQTMKSNKNAMRDTTTPLHLCMTIKQMLSQSQTIS
jgi:hypothetical protein